MEAGYKRLEVYQMAHDLAVKVHKMSLSLPKIETFEEASQIRRSSKSVSAQIVDGFALRKYRNEYIHYLYRAYGSSEETVEHLRVLQETGSRQDTTQANALIEGYLTLNRKLFSFIQAVERQHTSPEYLREPVTPYPLPTDLNHES